MVDKLPSKRGSTYEFMWGGLLLPFIGAIVLRVFGGMPALCIAVVCDMVSALCWFAFYRSFAIGCRGIKPDVSGTVMAIAWAILIGTALSVLPLFLATSDAGEGVAMACYVGYGIVSLAILGLFIRLGLTLKKHFIGPMGEIGSGILRAMLMWALAGIAMVAGAVVFNLCHVSPLFAVIPGALLALWALLIMYDVVWGNMVSLLEGGYFND